MPESSAAKRVAKLLRVSGVLIIFGEANTKNQRALGQGECEDVAAGRDGDILFAADGKTHRRSVHQLAGMKMPERRAGLSVDGFEGFGVVAKKSEAAGSGHGATGGMPGTDLRIAPGKFPGGDIERQQSFFRIAVARMLYAGGVIGAALFELLRFQEIRGAILQGQKVKQMCGGIVGRRVPVGGAFKAGADQCAFGGGRDGGADGAAV